MQRVFVKNIQKCSIYIWQKNRFKTRHTVVMIALVKSDSSKQKTRQRKDESTMEYEMVTLEEKITVGISARTNNSSPDMGAVIGGLWNHFYNDGIYASIPEKVSGKALGIYTDYAGNEKDDYTVVVACETAKMPLEENKYTVCRIPAGRYAKFVIHGDMVESVAKAWTEIWQMNLPRTLLCDFEEYQNSDMGNNAEIHIYIGLKEA